MKKSSNYNIILQEENHWLIFNSCQGLRSLARINPGEDSVLTALSGSFDEKMFTEEQIDRLLEKGFIVDESTNELEWVKYQYNQIVNGSTLCLTILPTRACNFRCTYCYESFESKHMDRGVCDALIKWVSKNIFRYSALSVSWFGGEPLVAMEVIEYLSEAFMKICKVGKKRYIANITTNGYLLDLDTFNKLLKYRVLKFQVTLDGLRERHDAQRKLCGGGSTFERIIDNIKNIKNGTASGRFNFIIRTNFSKDSIKEIPEYIRYLEDTINGDARFSLFVRTVSYLGGGDDVYNSNKEVITGYKERKEIFKTVSMTLNTIPLDVNYSLLNVGQCVCYAALHNHMVVDVGGEIRKCTCNLDDDDKNRIGDLMEDGSIQFNYELYNRWVGCFTSRKKCLNCKFLPICMQKNCPANDVYELKVGCPYEKLEFESILKAYEKNNYIKGIFEN